MLSAQTYRFFLFAAFMLHFSFAVLIDREHIFAVMVSFFALWAVFFVQWADQKMSVRKMLTIGMVFRFIYLLTFPELSDDFWRYLWDGMLVSGGMSPYETLPANWVEVGLNSSFGDLVPLLNSPEYYSIYPPVLQFLFGICVTFSDGNPLVFVVTFRCLVLMAELGSMVLIYKLLKAWKLDQRNLMLYALNPLVIIEFAGNLHGEVFMIFFLLMSLWLLTSSCSTKASVITKEEQPVPIIRELKQSENKEVEAERLPRNSENGFLAMMRFRSELLSAIAFGLSVATKLLPLMFLPFYIKRLGWRRTMTYGAVAAATAALLYMPFWSADLIPNVMSSVRLYFANFEFNASVYYVFREVGILLTGYNQIALIGPLLSVLVLVMIFLIAWRDKNKEISGLPTMMLFSWFVYYAFATTVNPWYVAVLAAFLPFTTYRFALLWLVLVPLSYHAFGNVDHRENSGLIVLQYVPVYLWLLMELKAFRFLEKKWALKRAEVKRKRLVPFLIKGQKVLEVGAGNGALTKLLSKEGMIMQPLDIADRTLFHEVKVEVYDGEKFPFQDKQFDVCQLITMLHHTDHAEVLIWEAKRVSDRIIIMEDIYENPFQKHLTWFADSVVNGEFYGHPHANRTDKEWRQLFDRNGLKVEEVEYYRFLFLFKQVTYMLSHAKAPRRKEMLN